MLARPELDDVSKSLLEMAEYIEEHGWCQNQVRDKKGQVCVAGAMHFSRNNLREGNNWSEAKARITKVTGCECNIVQWNNTPGRTKEEVINKLREAAYLGQIQE